MNKNSLWRTLTSLSAIVSILFLLVNGSIAALWWVPSAMAAEKPIPWKMGAICLCGLWFIFFNHWPRLGTQRFFRESKYLKQEFIALFLVSFLFALGFAVVGIAE